MTTCDLTIKSQEFSPIPINVGFESIYLLIEGDRHMEANQQQLEQQPQQPVQQVQQGETLVRHTRYGVYELRIIGDPNKLLEIPIEYFYGKNALLPRR